MSEITKTPKSVPIFTKLAYGAGGIAFGIKDNGFSVFLLIFYNQVVGLRADLVGLAALIALLVDAFYDPMVGHWSDKTRTKWGRRHPWLYFSLIPIGIAWFMLWSPPDWSQMALFFYLLLTAITVRFALSSYEVPSISMLPDLTHDYDERTEILRYRYLFGWGGGLVMLYLAYGVFLVPDPENGINDGLLNANGYYSYAICSTLIMVSAAFISALGTHKAVAKPFAGNRGGSHSISSFAEAMKILSYRPFILLVSAGVFAFANQGLTFALTNYLLPHIWHFGKFELSIYPFILFLGVVAAFFLAPAAGKKFEKPKAAALLAFWASIFISLPYWIYASGILPLEDNGMKTILIFLLLGLGTSCSIGSFIQISSMMADITDASEADNGVQSEGLFFAGFQFMQKCVTGVGIMLSGVMLSFIAFPKDAAVGKVDSAITHNLSLGYASLTLGIGIISALLFLRIKTSRMNHVAHLQKTNKLQPQEKSEQQ